MKEFEEIYSEYCNPIFGFMLKLTSGDHHMSEEITQECFYQAFISLHKFKGKSTFLVWLCAIAKNCYYKRIKKQREICMDINVLANELRDDDETEKIYEAKFTSSLMRDTILELNTQQRDIVIYRVYFEISYSEISKLMKISEESAKVAFFRAKEKLRKVLQDQM